MKVTFPDDGVVRCNVNMSYTQRTGLVTVTWSQKNEKDGWDTWVWKHQAGCLPREIVFAEKGLAEGAKRC